MSWTLELGYIRDDTETIVTTLRFDGTPRLGEYATVKPVEQTNDARAYRELGISHIIERVTVGAK